MVEILRSAPPPACLNRRSRDSRMPTCRACPGARTSFSTPPTRKHSASPIITRSSSGRCLKVCLLNKQVIENVQASWPSPHDPHQSVTILGESWASLPLPEAPEAAAPSVIISKQAYNLDLDNRRKLEAQRPISISDKYLLSASLHCKVQQPIACDFNKYRCVFFIL